MICLTPKPSQSFPVYRIHGKDGGAGDVGVIVVRNGHEFKSWTRLIAFSHSTNSIGKGMNPIILLPAMDK